MAFSPGTLLGVYEITGLIGVGGMGEVYRARDTKLGRQVAIKTLPSELAKDRDRLARFEREAKLLAAINHPHIAAIYGLHEHDGTQFLAMELVEGETLERALDGAALPIEDALRLALQIAQALEAAHEKGVVHRDLKPANIMITRGDQIKVLDFGLAKSFSTDPNKTALGHSPALSLAMTQAGLLLGTAGYMSPEQASGQPIDQRADIWAFGVVLYEMLTGVPLFSGESVPHVLAEVLKSEPDWNRLPENLHPRLKLLLERCLTKKPRSRLQAIADARVELEAVLADPNGMMGGRVVNSAPGNTRVLPALGAVGISALVVGAIAGWFLRPVPEPASGPVVRFSLPLPDEATFSATPLDAITISPDGSRIAYAADRQIFVHELREADAHPVPGTLMTEGLAVTAPTFSPDGQSLAYVQVMAPGGPFSVKRVPITGGTPLTIHEAQGTTEFPQGLKWATEDTIIFANAQGIVRIPSNGGATAVLVARVDGESVLSPQLLPGGKTVLFTSAYPQSQGGLAAARVVMQSINGNDRKTVWDGGSAARYLASGHLVYAQGLSLFATPFDPQSGTARGGSVRIIEGLRRPSTPFSDSANFAVSDNGTLVMLPPNPFAEGGRDQTTLAWVDRDGRETPLPIRPDDYTLARISPDGSKIALVISSGLRRVTRPAIWIFDLRTENLRLLTADPAGDDTPLWSSDGQRIFFRSFRGGRTGGVYAIDVETGETTPVGVSAEYPFSMPWAISPGDRDLLLINGVTVDNFNITKLAVADVVFSPLLHESVSESEPSLSPNGAWMAYAVGRLRSQIDIVPYPGVSRTRIPVGPGQSPVFSRDGSELFYYDGSGLSVVPISYEPTLRVGTPRRLFESAGYQWAVDGRAWDFDPSGQRFLMIRERPNTADDTREGEQIDVVLNWFEELKSRVPLQ